MKHFIIILVLLIPLCVSAQTPMYGDRLFISADRQDTLVLQFKPDGIYLKGDKPLKLSAFNEKWLTDSMRYGSKSYVLAAVATKLNASDTARYISKSQARKDIHDSLATIFYSIPELSIKMANDTTDYEMTASQYNLNIQYTLRRPSGCRPITSIKVNGTNYTVPTVNENQTVTGTLAISFTGPSYPQGVLTHSKLYTVAVAAGKDTVKQDITLNQYWRMYMAFAGYDPSFNGAMSPYLYTNTTIKPLVKNGVCEVLNFNPAGNQIIIAVPTGYDGNLKVINGITLNLFIPAVQTFYNLTNAKGATHRYEAFYTDNSFLRTLQKFELR